MIGNASNGKIWNSEETAEFIGTHYESFPRPLQEPAPSSAEAGINDGPQLPDRRCPRGDLGLSKQADAAVERKISELRPEPRGVQGSHAPNVVHGGLRIKRHEDLKQ